MILTKEEEKKYTITECDVDNAKEFSKYVLEKTHNQFLEIVEITKEFCDDENKQIAHAINACITSASYMMAKILFATSEGEQEVIKNRFFYHVQEHLENLAKDLEKYKWS